MTILATVKTFFERNEATEDQLIEETFALIKQLDETDDPTEAALLEAQITERSDDLDELEGFAVLDVSGDLMAVCLDESQAQAIRQLLMLTDGGFVTTVAPFTAPIDEFVHPETDVGSIVLLLAEPEGEKS